MNLLIANLLAAALAGLGLYAVIARRHAVMVLIGAELLVNAGVLLLVTSDLRHTDPEQASLFTGQVGALFAITIAAAEIGLALAGRPRQVAAKPASGRRITAHSPAGGWKAAWWVTPSKPSSVRRLSL